jgi:hypothetical protein
MVFGRLSGVQGTKSVTSQGSRSGSVRTLRFAHPTHSGATCRENAVVRQWKWFGQLSRRPGEGRDP